MPSLWNEFALGDAILIAVAFIIGRLYEVRQGVAASANAAYTAERARLAAEADHARDVEQRAMQLAARRRRVIDDEEEGAA